MALADFENDFDNDPYRKKVLSGLFGGGPAPAPSQSMLKLPPVRVRQSDEDDPYQFGQVNL
jgi:hypothetical protein